MSRGKNWGPNVKYGKPIRPVGGFRAESYALLFEGQQTRMVSKLGMK
jgi:hypothetical protein